MAKPDRGDLVAAANATQGALENLQAAVGELATDATEVPPAHDEGDTDTEPFMESLRETVSLLHNLQQRILILAGEWADHYASGPGEAAAINSIPQEGFIRDWGGPTWERPDHEI